MNYYYKDENNAYYCFEEENADLIPITEEEWKMHYVEDVIAGLSETTKTNGYFYKDNEDNYYAFEEENPGLIPVSLEEWKTHLLNDIIPNPTQEEEVQISTLDRIYELKNLLADSDYKALKYLEGFISEQEYLPIKTQRQAWRDEINSLEEQL